MTRQAQVARLIAHVMMDRDVPLHIEAISKASGLTEERVRALMASDTFEDMVAPVIRRKAAAAIGRGVDAMVSIMEGSSADKDKIAAFRSLTGAMDTMARADSGHSKHDANQQIATVLDNLKGMNKKKILKESPK